MKFWIAELLFIASSAALAGDRLAGYAADAKTFTVSGVSSGGYMAVQMHVAHSRRVKGAAVLAAGPYYCAQGSLWTAMESCTSPGGWSPLPDVNALKDHTEQFAREGLIDPLGNLTSSRVWLFTGRLDRTVNPEVVEALATFYSLFNAKYVLVKDKPAGHAMVTEDAGNACGASAPPFINHCNYDAAGELLHYLVGKLSPRAAKESGRLLAFDQREFADAYAISMDDRGYVYVPRACETEPCDVHVAFHGCRQGAATVGERFAREAGYNRWADTNHLIVLYPQVIARYWWVYNPHGCWDWWGYTGSKYATKEGVQIRAVMAMLGRLGEPRKK